MAVIQDLLKRVADAELRARLVAVLAGLSTVAGPRVEITDVRIEDHAQGIVGFTYEVGDLGDKSYNLMIKAGVTRPRSSSLKGGGHEEGE